MPASRDTGSYPDRAAGAPPKLTAHDARLVKPPEQLPSLADEGGLFSLLCRYKQNFF